MTDGTRKTSLVPTKPPTPTTPTKPKIPSGGRKLGDFFDKDGNLKKGEGGLKKVQPVSTTSPKPTDPAAKKPVETTTESKQPTRPMSTPQVTKPTPIIAKPTSPEPLAPKVETSTSPASPKPAVETPTQPMAAESMSSTPAMTWGDVEDLETFLKFLEQKVFGNNDYDIEKDYNDFYRDREKNNFIEKYGGVKKIKDTISQEKPFHGVIGYKPKTKHWWSSRENKLLYNLEKAYNKNNAKINGLKNENENLRKNLDPLSGGFGNEVLKGINGKGIHLRKTREEAMVLFNKLRSDFADNFFEVSDEARKKAFKNLSPEEKALAFKSYLYDVKNNDPYNKNKSAFKLLRKSITSNINPKLDKIRINSKLIDKGTKKNLEIIGKANPVVEKKKGKIELEEQKKELEKLIKSDFYEEPKAQTKSKEVAEKVSKLKENLKNLRKNSDKAVSNSERFLTAKRNTLKRRKRFGQKNNETFLRRNKKNKRNLKHFKLDVLDFNKQKSEMEAKMEKVNSNKQEVNEGRSRV